MTFDNHMLSKDVNKTKSYTILFYEISHSCLLYHQQTIMYISGPSFTYKNTLSTIIYSFYFVDDLDTTDKATGGNRILVS